MAQGMKRLAKETAVYGLSTIIGKTLNWSLVPLYTRVLVGTSEFGIMSNLYAWTALLQVLLTYGMETGFFRFINKEEKDPMRVYASTLICIGCTSLLFIVLGLSFLHPISAALGYQNTSGYVAMLIVIVAVDAFASIPFAYLRYKGRPIRFSVIKFSNILLTIALNLFFLLLCPWLYVRFPATVSWFYIPDFGVGYIFVSNIIASVTVLLMLMPQLTGFAYRLDWPLLRKMLRYSLPILMLGVAGILNQTVDKILFPFLFSDREYADSQLGIYTACFKIAVVLVMFVQAFRYAYEPFIFARNKGADNRLVYAQVMKYFVIFTLFIFLGVMFYLDILKYFVAPRYYPGLKVVPIVMLGEFFFGIYFNLSFWYKLLDQTKWGAYFSGIGCLVTVLIVIGFVPAYGFIACAWASFVCNLLMMLLSYFVGQKKFPIAYDLKSFFFYFGFAMALFAAGMLPPIHSEILRLGYRTVLLGIFVAVVLKRDIPLRELPFIGPRFASKTNK